jgi:hypothetical protein
VPVRSRQGYRRRWIDVSFERPRLTFLPADRLAEAIATAIATAIAAVIADLVATGIHLAIHWECHVFRSSAPSRPVPP